MCQLTNADILRNRVDTINQYKILQYLKNNLNIYEFQLFLYDEDTIKVVDKENEFAYFRLQKDTDDILFLEELEDKKQDFEMLKFQSFLFTFLLKK